MQQGVQIFILKETYPHYWCLYNPNGHKMCPPQRFVYQEDAVAWFDNYLSSWTGFVLEVQPYVNEKSTTAVLEQTD
jgi:hypothetical protein